MWRPGVRGSNVWVSTAQVHEQLMELMELMELRPVQNLPGGSHPFQRLVTLLVRDEYRAAGIDAPFALPARHMPAGGFPMLLQDVAQFPTGNRPFAKGKELVAYGEANASLEERKPMRKTEHFWRKRGVNVRSTLWNGPRGGAPFTVANLTLLAQVRRAVWPWSRAVPGLLVESFPAGQLGDVLRFLSKKNDVWFPKLKPVPVMGTEKENHTSWERYYRVSDCSSSSGTTGIWGDESLGDRPVGSSDDASICVGARGDGGVGSKLL